MSCGGLGNLKQYHEQETYTNEAATNREDHAFKW